MSCCDTNKHDCSQGHICELHDKLASQRADWIEAWLYRNQGLIASSSITVALSIIAVAWLFS